MKRLAGWIACGLLAVGIIPLQATVVVYNSQSAWLAAVTGVQTVNFDSTGTGGYSTLAVGPALNQINISVDGGSPVFVSNGSSYVSNDFSNVVVDSNNFGAMHFTSAAGNTASLMALAANLFTGSALTGRTVTVNVYLVGAPSTIAFTTTVTTFNASGQTPVFFGLTSDQAIDHVDFVTSGNFDGPVVVDNLQWGQLDVVAAPTPEIPTYAYIGVGLAALFFGLHKRHSLA